MCWRIIHDFALNCIMNFERVKLFWIDRVQPKRKRKWLQISQKNLDTLFVQLCVLKKMHNWHTWENLDGQKCWGFPSQHVKYMYLVQGLVSSLYCSACQWRFQSLLERGSFIQLWLKLPEQRKMIMVSLKLVTRLTLSHGHSWEGDVLFTI